MRPLSSVAVGLALAVAVLSPSPAQARAAREVEHGYAQVWNAVVRLLRVDLGCPVTERDEDTGFVLFEYPEGATRHPGSAEVIRTGPRGAEVVRVVVQIPGLPSYISQMIVDRLERKLFEDYGAPPPRPATPPAPPPGSAGSGPSGRTPAGRARPTERAPAGQGPGGERGPVAARPGR